MESNENIPNFYWNFGGGIQDQGRSSVESFSYEILDQYEGIVIDTVETENVIEIGAFINNDCIGAVEVYSYPTEILAYVDENHQGQEITFQLITQDDRGNVTLKSPGNLEVLNFNNQNFYNEPLIAGNQKFVTIRLNHNSISPKQVSIYNVSNYPNPFNPSTVISYNLTTNDNISLKIYNVKGQLVKTVVDEKQTPGKYLMIWDGTDQKEIT